MVSKVKDFLMDEGFIEYVLNRKTLLPKLTHQSTQLS